MAPIKISLANRLYLGFALVVLLVLLSGLLTWRTFDSQMEESSWVQHTYHVLNNSERVQRLLFDMEAARRGFRSTFDHKFLKPYELALPKVAPALNDLHTLVSDNPEQYKNVDSLEDEVNNLLSYWNELDHSLDQQRFEQNKSITETEALLMDRVRAKISLVNAEERRLLSLRENYKNESFSKAVRALLINNAFILLVGFILMRVTYIEFKRRIRAQKTLNLKLTEVVDLNEAANERNWMLTGVNKMNDSLQGANSREELVHHALQTLTTFGEFAAGAFYHFNEEAKHLRLEATVNMPAAVPAVVAINDGFVGTAASNPDLRVIRGVPPSYWQLASASGNGVAGELVLIPLWVDNELLGVIELASFKPVTQLQVSLLEILKKDIAVAVNAANAREKVMQLLRQVQEQKEILISQQEELRQSNEELSRQSEVLQASEEELRVQEEELRQVNTEITVKNYALELARNDLSQKAAELEASSRYKSEFLANMSHELRTPLNSVLILAKMLQENKDRNLTTKQMEYAGIIHKSGSDLLHLINDVLDLSKIEAGKVEMNFEAIPVSEIMDDLSDLFDVVSQEKKIQFIKTIAPDVPTTLFTDKLRLEQVIRNLLSNAFKFTPAAGVITLSWYMVNPDTLCISVSDTGGGIPADKQALIFNAFHQGDGSTSRKFGGTGLGLSISRELMQLLKGSLELDNSSPAGSTFSITIPVHPDADAIVTTADAPEYTPSPLPTPAISDDRDNISKQDKLILIIEDDIHFADILRDFARNKGFKTIVAYNGQDGLAYARKYLPVAIILDMNLPVIDGKSILKILKSNEELSKILVHVVTAADNAGIGEDNVHGYTRKPLQLPDLEAVFTNISTRMQAGLKKVLLLSAGPRSADAAIKAKSEERHLETQYDIAASMPEARQLLAQKKYDTVIMEIGAELELDKVIEQLEALTSMPETGNAPLIVYLDQDITSSEEQQLKKYAAAIVRNSALATDRLMDELELFLYKLEKKEKAAYPETPGATTILSGKKVLLADDDMRNVFSISALLEDQGIEVLTAADGKEAVQTLQEHPQLDLVLLDIMMPEMDGYEAMRLIRADPRFQQLPVIALTAKAMAEDRVKCMEAGASDYIAKPVDNIKLLSLLKVWLS
ncbi:signal transduction histidine kinase [Chitinophaga polysaccharea]|uniref:histidine kinase n=1 Tax=Chitinophaga polysaccharea TaxID=1293035 RepID=A0A561PTL4_9BACT|nr:response regulator [Chitinophaga polysaccharea]TWF41459.1 signal transduction histidine kinase [Chitinophaga polysaccharea]